MAIEPLTGKDRFPVRFGPGDWIEVLDLDPPRHMRIPMYIRHKVGQVLELRGLYLNPEQLADGDKAGPVIPVYRVSFFLRDIWPKEHHGQNDRLLIEIYDHWMKSKDIDSPERDE